MTALLFAFSISMREMKQDIMISQSTRLVILMTTLLNAYSSDEYIVHLVPSPIAEVKEGDALNLQCSCNGSHNPDFINWYLDNDTYGLVIDTSSCNYQIRPVNYEIDRYKISCLNESKFILSISNISKDKDDHDTWKCDTTVIGMEPPSKASTTIKVIDTGKTNCEGRSSGVPNNVSWIVVPGGIAIISAVAGCLLYRRRINVDGCLLHRRRRNDHGENTTNQDNEQMNSLVDLNLKQN